MTIIHLHITSRRVLVLKNFDSSLRSVIALAGDDFCVIAADTRLSAGFSIYTREQQKLFPLSATTVLGCSGCWCDVLTLSRILAARMQVTFPSKTQNRSKSKLFSFQTVRSLNYTNYRCTSTNIKKT